MDFDINRPWLSLDPWQKKYVFDEEDVDNFLLTTRQGGKTTGMSLRSVELCVKHYKKGEFVLINSITEKQAYHMLAKARVYAEEFYGSKIITKGNDKPTKHKLMFKNGTGILCYAAGDTGEGLRGFTIKKIMSDEGSRMSEEYFTATLPALSVVKGTLDIASTPYGRKHKDGSPKFFYTCSLDPDFKKYFVSAADCPRHTPEYLEKMKRLLSKQMYAQEFLAEFTDAMRTLFDEDWLNKVCTGKRPEIINPKSSKFMGNDIAGLGGDAITYEIVEHLQSGKINQIENISETYNLTTETTKKIIYLNRIYDFFKIGIDDGGPGFGVWSELMDHEDTRRKTVALNNSSRPVDHAEEKSKRLLKEEMYILMQTLGEKGILTLLDDDEVRASLASIQHDEGKVFGYNAHIAEGINRAVYLASKEKGLNIFAHTF